MEQVYLVCSRKQTFTRLGLTASTFTDLDIKRFISELRSKPFTSEEQLRPQVFCVFSSRKKAEDSLVKYNSTDEFNHIVWTYKNTEGRDYLRKLTVYDYYIVSRPLI